jgi:hypothetical protein
VVLKSKAAARSKAQPAPVSKRGKLSEVVADRIRAKANKVLAQ